VPGGGDCIGLAWTKVAPKQKHTRREIDSVLARDVAESAAATGPWVGCIPGRAQDALESDHQEVAEQAGSGQLWDMIPGAVAACHLPCSPPAVQ
jgi:hypothetical protein